MGVLTCYSKDVYIQISRDKLGTIWILILDYALQGHVTLKRSSYVLKRFRYRKHVVYVLVKRFVLIKLYKLTIRRH